MAIRRTALAKARPSRLDRRLERIAVRATVIALITVVLAAPSPLLARGGADVVSYLQAGGIHGHPTDSLEHFIHAARAPATASRLPPPALPSENPASGTIEHGIPLNAGWENITGSVAGSPPAMTVAGAMVYDPADGYLIMFGGQNTTTVAPTNQTWILQNRTWVQLHPTPAPPARSLSSMVWDPVDGTALLFGGETTAAALNDTWSFAHGRWSQVMTAHAPPARFGATFVWDVGDAYGLLFGGSTDVSNPGLGIVNDTWEYSGGDWHPIPQSSPPPGREYASSAYDATGGYVVLTGGENQSTGPLNDTWTFGAGHWTHVGSPAGFPANRSASMGFDPDLGAIVLYGGCAYLCQPAQQTWEFSAGNWRLAPTGASPGPRADASLAYLPAESALVLFGGFGTSPGSTYPSTWIFYTVNVSVQATSVGFDLPASFNASASESSGVAPFLLSWDFGDGTIVTSRSQSVIHPYRNEGSFTVTLNVTDSQNVTSDSSLLVSVFTALAFSSTAAPLSGPPPLNVSVDAAGAGGDPPYAFIWTTGTGAVITIPSATFEYQNPGTYPLQLLVSDVSGEHLNRTFLIHVASPIRVIPPVSLALSANRTVGEVPLIVGFWAEASGGNGSLTYTWSLGNGSTAQGSAVDHTYQAPGEYNVSVAVSDAYGHSTMGNVSVRVYPTLEVQSSVTPSDGPAPLSITTTSVIKGGLPPYVTQWSIDGVDVSTDGYSALALSSIGSHQVLEVVTDAAAYEQVRTFIVNVTASATNGNGGTQASPPVDLVVPIAAAAVAFGAGVAATWVLLRKRSPPPDG